MSARIERTLIAASRLTTAGGELAVKTAPGRPTATKSACADSRSQTRAGATSVASASALTLGERPRILVVKLATLGDLLLATPMLRALRARYPQARLDLLTSAVAAPLIVDSPLLDHVYTFEKRAFDDVASLAGRPGELGRLAPLALRLRANRYDAVILAHHLTLPAGRLKYRALLATIHPAQSVGLDNGHGRFLSLRVGDEGFGALHEAEYALALAAALDAPAPEGDRGLRLADLGWPTTTPPPLRAGEAPQIALHPGGGAYSLARRWPASRFVELAQALWAEFGASLTLLGDADERALQAEILDALGRPRWATALPAPVTPRELAAILGASHLFIGNDSLPMHLAAAAGTPVIAVFGPSNAQAWGPYAPHAPERAIVVRRDDLPCSPCIYRGHALGTPEGCPPRPCLTALRIDPVLLAARRLLRRPTALRPASPAS
ncbi:MAG TPA: glycosyltransferase family 9 protein [Ktedonobacterales bacterium]